MSCVLFCCVTVCEFCFSLFYRIWSNTSTWVCLWVRLFPVKINRCRICRYERECSMRLWAILLSLCAGCPFCSSLFQKNDLCFKLTILVSGEGALHNRQIWPEAPRATKLSVLSPQITLMWNNLVLCLWCFPPFSPCCTAPLLSFILSSIDLQMYCILPIGDVLPCISLVLFFAAVCFVLSWMQLPRTSLFYIVRFFSPQPRSLLDPKLLGLQTGGWVVARFSIRSVQNYANLSCRAVLRLLAEAHT